MMGVSWILRLRTPDSADFTQCPVEPLQEIAQTKFGCTHLYAFSINLLAFYCKCCSLKLLAVLLAIYSVVDSE